MLKRIRKRYIPDGVYNSNLIREQLEKRDEQLTEWRNQFKAYVDTPALVGRFENIRDSIHSSMLEAVVGSFATIDGIERANKSIKSVLDMQDASIETATAISFEKKLFRIETLKYLLGYTTLDSTLRESILNLHVKKEFGSLVSGAVSSEDTEALVRERLKKEIQRYETDSPAPSHKKIAIGGTPGFRARDSHPRTSKKSSSAR